jgi:hypothetical protein
MFWVKENAVFLILLIAIIWSVVSIVVGLFLARFLGNVKKSVGRWDDQLISTRTDVQLISTRTDVKSRAMLVISGTEMKRIPKSRMFDKSILYCTEVGGICKGPECGHYRTNINGNDICRFNAIEFT